MANQGFAYREQVGAEGRGLTVLAYLARQYQHATVEEWRERIARGEVRLGDREALPNELLSSGDQLVWHRPAWTEAEVPLSFEVIYEDEDLLAVAKPSGLPTMPGGGFLENTLLALVRRRAPEASPMHRLGRGTSGLVLFSRTELAGSRLQEAWRGHQVRKVYRALASGTIERDAFTVTTPIGPVRHPLLGEIFAASDSGKKATSHVTVVERRASDTLVDVVIETGRPHQIRIHLAAVGHPLVGDPLYVSGGHPAPDALPGDTGYLLHAASLSFVHPRSGQLMALTCRCPPQLLASGTAAK